MNRQMYRTWAEVNKSALTHNIKEIRKKISPETKLMAVVKADGYGHGGVEVSNIFLDAGANFLAVATTEEGIQLRKANIAAPILIMGPVTPYEYEEIVLYELTPTIFCYNDARVLSAVCCKQKKQVKIHIKIDTGMGRIGYLWREYNKEVVEEIQNIHALEYIDLEGIFTHLACSEDEDNPYNSLQAARFLACIEELREVGITPRLKHICNSAGILNFPNMHLDMVRSGISCYGIYPDRHLVDKIDLQQAITIKSRVAHIKNLDIGNSISYGSTVTLEEKKKIATIPIGYGDGYSRGLSNKAQMIAGNQYVNIIGKICMDQCMIDVSCVHNISVGDEVIVMGDEKTSISAESLARELNTIGYEIICAIGKRIPRIYI